MKAVPMPALGVAMSEGILVSWLKTAGDAVLEGEPVAEVETDKTLIEIPSPADGIVGPLLFNAGDAVPVGVAMTHIVEIGDASAPSAFVSKEPTKPDAEAGAHESAALASAASSPAEVAGRAPHRLSPRERRLAAEQVTSELEDASAVPDGSGTEPTGGGRHRALIATKVSESWRTIPHFSVSREIDAAAMVDLRKRYGQAPPTFTELMIKGLALALRDQGGPGSIDVGLAVATSDGVAIPVIRDVLDLDFAHLREVVQEAISRARMGRLVPADLSEPPRSTLSNLGPLGIDTFTGIIAVGQVSLLTVGRIVPRPYVLNSTVAIRDSFIATLNVDHRVFDGAEAADLLRSFAAAIEGSERLEIERPIG